MIKKNPLAMKFKEIFKRSHSFDHSWRYPDIEFIHIRVAKVVTVHDDLLTQ